MPRRDEPARIRRIRAQNPSPLTHTGTNSYILGSGRVAVIDPGPMDESHLQALLAALEPGEEISHILVTHPHRDHSALAPLLAARTGAPILAHGRAEEGRTEIMTRLAASGLISAGGDGLDMGFAPDVRLQHGDRIEGSDWCVTVHHTPGHLGTHLCYALEDTLFSGDHVMGWSTSVVIPPDGDMGAYRASLAALATGTWSSFLPGHGEAVEKPAERLAELIAHRQMREVQILTAMIEGPSTVDDLTARVYPSLSPSLVHAARQNVLAHLLDLMAKNRVTAADPTLPMALFQLI